MHSLFAICTPQNIFSGRILDAFPSANAHIYGANYLLRFSRISDSVLWSNYNFLRSIDKFRLLNCKLLLVNCNRLIIEYINLKEVSFIFVLEDSMLLMSTFFSVNDNILEYVQLKKVSFILIKRSILHFNFQGFDKCWSWTLVLKLCLIKEFP